MKLYLFGLFLNYVVSVLYHVSLTSAAFTLNTSFSAGYIQLNRNSTWCYYPYLETTVSCEPDYTFIVELHLNQTTSIGYYQPDGTRSGGPEWSVPTNPGELFLCGSGRAGDGTYRTFCAAPVTANDSVPNPGCLVNTAQTVVTDGCYTPGQPPYPNLNGTGTASIVFSTMVSSHPRGPYPHFVATATLLSLLVTLLMMS